MKKELRKQIEKELNSAMEKVLSLHDKKAVSKTKKAVSSASKTVAKKFTKFLKSPVTIKKIVAGKKVKAPATSMKTENSPPAIILSVE